MLMFSDIFTLNSKSFQICGPIDEKTGVVYYTKFAY